VLGRLGAEHEIDSVASDPVSSDPVELERGDARFLLTVDRWAPPVAEPEPELIITEAGQLELFAELPTEPRSAATACPELVPLAAPPLHKVRRLSYSALALFERCSYRYYVERVAGLREERGTVPGAHGLKATEIGDAVHRCSRSSTSLLRHRPTSRSSAAGIGGERRRGRADLGVRRVVLRIRARGADRDLVGAEPERPFAFEHDGGAAAWAPRRALRDGTRALVLDYKTNTLAEGTPEEIVEADYGCSGWSMRSRASARARRRSRSSTTSSSARTPSWPPRSSDSSFRLSSLSSLRQSRRSTPASSFRRERVQTAPVAPRWTLVCAGPRLGGARGLRLTPPSPWLVTSQRWHAAISPSPAEEGCAEKERIRRSSRLATEHPDATIALTFTNPLELLISVMLSAQTTDVNVNRVTEKLFAKYKRPEDYLAVPVAELERDIFATGFYRPEGEIATGRDAAHHRGVRRRGARRLRRAAEAARRGTQDRERRVGGAGQPAGIVVDTHVRRLRSG